MSLNSYPQSAIRLAFVRTGVALEFAVLVFEVAIQDKRENLTTFELPLSDENQAEAERLLIGCMNHIEYEGADSVHRALQLAITHLATHGGDTSEVRSQISHALVSAAATLPINHANYADIGHQAIIGGQQVRINGWLKGEDTFIHFNGAVPKSLQLTGYGYHPVRKIWDESIASAEDVSFHQQSVAKEMKKPVRRMICSCCGSETKGRQWFNQDTGYGLCPSCIQYVATRSTDPLEFTHGIQGVNFDLAD